MSQIRPKPKNQLDNRFECDEEPKVVFPQIDSQSHSEIDFQCVAIAKAFDEFRIVARPRERQCTR